MELLVTHRTEPLESLMARESLAGGAHPTLNGLVSVDVHEAGKLSLKLLIETPKEDT